MLETLAHSRPDITICDWRHDFWLARRLVPPRCSVSIVRCQQLFGYRRLSTHLPDKFAANPARLSPWLVEKGLRPLRTLRELYLDDVVVVPSIPELDPPSIHPSRYDECRVVYPGPLSFFDHSTPSREVRAWITRQRIDGRKILLVTLGTVWGDEYLEEFASYFGAQTFATLMVVMHPEIRRRLNARGHRHLLAIDFSPLLPLMRAVDIVMHHAGQATSLTTLLARKPALILPSGHCDREDTAIRLERLACGRRLSERSLRRGVDIVPLMREMLESVPVRRATARMAARIGAHLRSVGVGAVLNAIAESYHAKR
jgi:UDP:flavonoid glycosyltransferase YjiC (YdhE family)